MKNDKRRVLMMMSEVLPVGGAENTFYLLNKHRRQDLFDYRVVVPKEGPMVDRVRGLGVPVEVRSLVRARDLWRLPWFVGYLRRNRIEIVNTHGVRAAFYCSLARRFVPIRIVVTEHNLQDWRASGFWNRVDRYIARHTDHRVAISQAVADSIVAAGVSTRDKISVITTGIEPEAYSRDPDLGRKARRRLGIADDEILIAAAGLLDRMKGFHILVSAAPAVFEAVPNARIVIIGKGEEFEPLKRQISETGVGDRVSLPGYVDDLRSVLSGTDLFVLPSVSREGLPMVLAEAMASECPIVTTDISGNKEIVQHGRNGLVVEPDNSQALAQGIVQIIKGPDRERFGREGRKIVEERFSIHSAVEAYSSLFLSILHSR
jgi:glycosyltransferase involved in cell wall biosynthesis